jgi:hypothetical protein
VRIGEAREIVSRLSIDEMITFHAPTAISVLAEIQANPGASFQARVDAASALLAAACARMPTKED